MPKALDFWPKGEGWPKALVDGVEGAPNGFSGAAEDCWKGLTFLPKTLPPVLLPLDDSLQMSIRFGCLLAASKMNWTAAGMFCRVFCICCWAAW